MRRSIFLFLIIYFACMSVLYCILCAEEIVIYEFNNDKGLNYNPVYIEIYQGKLRLAPTGFWTNTGELTNYTYPTMLFQDSKGNMFYSGAELGPSGCIYKSSNYGITWAKVYWNSSGACKMIEGTDGNLYITVGYWGPFGDFIKSYDNGDSWESISPPVLCTYGLLEDSNNFLYVCGHRYRYSPLFPSWSSNYLYRSSDYGTNWTLIYKDGTGGVILGRFLCLFELNNNNLIMGTSSGVYISSNYGSNWKLIPEAMNFSCEKILRLSDGSIYLSGSGILQSRDEAQSWQVVSTEPCSELIEADDGIFYKTYQSNVWKSFDKGYTWQKTANLIKDTVNFGCLGGGALIQADDGRIYVGAATNGYKGGYVFRSGYPASADVILLLAPNGNLKRWCSFTKSDRTNGGDIKYEFQYSTDNGLNWSSWFSLNDANLQNINCGGNGSDVLKVRITLYSSNHTTTPEIDWIKLSYEYRLSSRITALEPSEGDFFVRWGKIKGESTSGGTETNALSHTEIRIKHIKDNTYWDGNEWVSTSNTWVIVDGKEQWEYNAADVKWTLNDEYYVQSCAVNKKGEREDVKSGRRFIIVYTLIHRGFCNYPNPFDPNKEKTCIEYLLTSDEDVKIVIYTLNGELIKEWEFKAGERGGREGINRIYWDGRDRRGYKVANGVYFAILLVKGEKWYTKILVLK